jgi:hypothetical protein
MTYEPSDAMVEAAADAIDAEFIADGNLKDAARAALRAAFAAAIESGEAFEGKSLDGVPSIILRIQKGDK